MQKLMNNKGCASATCLLIILLSWVSTVCAADAVASPARVTVKLDQLQLPELRLWWPSMEFDQDSRFLCLVWTTWLTNVDFTEKLHYAIFDEHGALRCSSESSQNNEALIEKFPRLAMKRLHAGLISDAQNTNTFLDDPRWAVASDFSSCVLVRQMKDLSDVVEFWTLKPHIEKRWSWTRKEAFGPPDCRLQYVALNGKEVIAVDCSFSETVFLEAATGTQIDKIPYGQGNENYTALSTCIIPARGWLICGKGDSKRIRILRLASPHTVVKEFGTKGINAFGSWSTPRIESVANGRYLLKESFFGSRLLRSTRETEVIDAETWKVLWSDVDHGTGTVVISPDGRRMAIRRGKLLEIRVSPFIKK